MFESLKFSYHQLKLKTFNALVHGRFNLPGAIGIEISTACNRRCSYCPQSVEPKKQKIIEPEVWRMFIKRIQEYKWRGATSIIKYNEPSLVPASWKFVEELSDLGCRPLVFSNGDKPDIVRKWCEAGAFRVIITEHEPTKKDWYKNLHPILLDYPNILRIAPLTWIHNQAGKVEGETFEKCYNANGISVNIDGTVSMCCVDYNSEYIMGDIMKESFHEIWNKPLFKEIRRKVIKGIPATKMCENCFTKK